MFPQRLKEITKKVKIYLFNIGFFLLFFSIQLSAQTFYRESDSLICINKFHFAETDSLSRLPINMVFLKVAESFIGTPYAAHTIETPDAEIVKVHLSGLDCYTFIESSLAISRLIKEKNYSFSNYLKEIESIRYRSGKLSGWTSRLHYFSDWIYDLSQRGIVKNITKDLGGIPYVKKINFMSANFKAYPKLKNNPAFTDSIKKIESVINKRKYYFIPQDSIANIEGKIFSGDILGITTNIPGLDISHTAIAVRLDDGRVHILHAPNVGKKVQISSLPLSEYIKSHKHQTGIMVVRISPAHVK